MTEKLKILVVDDEPPITKVVARLLKSHGYEAIEVNDPRKVEDYILYTDLSLVISDVKMPGLNGLDLLAEIKHSKPDLPVIMLTGMTDIDTAVQATKLGAAEYLTKPLNNDAILRAVRTHANVDHGLPDGVKDYIASSMVLGEEEAAVEPGKIVLPNEIVSTDTIPEGLVEVKFEHIVPGQFLAFALYIQIYNKATNKFYLRKVSEENTVFTSGLKEILCKRNLNSAFIREQDYKHFLEYQKGIKDAPAFKHQQIRDNKRLVLYGKAVEAVTEILTDPGDNRNVKAAITMVDDMFKAMVDDADAYRDLFKLFQRDTSIFNHSANVCLLAVSFGVYLGLKREVVNILGLGAMFHDIGMNRVDRKILEKKGPLTRMEWDEIKKHPDRGFALMKSAIVVSMPALRIILEHHEREDGSGYPRALKGEAISTATRLCQMVDKFDGMTTQKPYREAFSPGEALKRIYYEEQTEKHRNYVKKFIAFLGGK